MNRLEVKVSDVALRDYFQSGLLFDLGTKTISALPRDAKLVNIEVDSDESSIVALFEHASFRGDEHKSSLQKRFLFFNDHQFVGVTRVRRVDEEPPAINYACAIFTGNDWCFAKYLGENVWKSNDGREYRGVQVYMPMPVLSDEILKGFLKTQ